MESISVKVIIQPLVNVKNSTEVCLSDIKVELKITLKSGTLIKDVCKEILTKIGLGSLSKYSNGYIELPDSGVFSLDSFDDKLNLSIGNIENLVGESLTIKIVAPGKIGDFTTDKLKKTVYSNLVQLLLEKVPSIPNWISNSIIKSIVEIMSKLPYEEMSVPTLLQFNDIIEKEICLYNKSKENGMKTVNLNVNIDLNELAKSQSVMLNVNVNLEPQVTLPPVRSFATRVSSAGNENTCSLQCSVNGTPINNHNFPSRIRLVNLPQDVWQINSNFRSKPTFDPVQELPLLERWYQHNRTASSSDFKRYAYYLNCLSRRSSTPKVASRDIKSWFKERRRFRSLSEMRN